MFWDVLDIQYGGGGGNRTRYHEFSAFQGIPSKTMKAYMKSGGSRVVSSDAVLSLIVLNCQ